MEECLTDVIRLRQLSLRFLTAFFGSHSVCEDVVGCDKVDTLGGRYMS